MAFVMSIFLKILIILLLIFLKTGAKNKVLECIIVPLHKNGNKNLAENYRPIALINYLVKLYETSIFKKYRNILNENIKSYQFGFVERKSAKIQYEILNSWIDEKFNISKVDNVFLLFIDFKKAYDYVNRKILIEKLENYKMPNEFINAIKLIFKDQTLRVLNSKMPWINISRGVRQGSPLSPILFNLYINDLFDFLELDKRLFIRAYADDILIASDDYQSIAKACEVVANWCNTNYMEINKGTDKTAIMILSRKNEICFDRYEENDYASLTKSYKYLGNVIKIRKDGKFFINRYSLEQYRIRLPKFRFCLNNIARSIGQDSFNYKSIKILIESCIRGNLYGMGNIAERNEKKMFLTGEKAKLETCVRKLLRKVLHAPQWCPIPILHLITKIPSCQLILREIKVNRLKELWKNYNIEDFDKTDKELLKNQFLNCSRPIIEV
ncbi:unnamed protein product [Blepharisma stoltei]|uniref:Reverse transcriptase domain-containing protein n=1 Tax=Blepharisma stoltei TaxID=1481888 RepID=A0AAU9IHJ6_9CILI|nr:unnamed protein product [Blepharisma stoltei]